MLLQLIGLEYWIRSVNLFVVNGKWNAVLEHKLDDLFYQFKKLIVYTISNVFMSLIIPSDHQWMAVGASGLRGNHAVWRVEGDTGHVLAHALIQRQNGTERIALGQVSTQKAAICTNAKVEAFFRNVFPLNDFGLSWCSCMFYVRFWFLSPKS